jgi:predicted amidohydrolase
VILNAYGQAVAECVPGKVDTAVALLDMDELHRFRQKFPVLADADDFLLASDQKIL